MKKTLSWKFTDEQGRGTREIWGGGGVGPPRIRNLLSKKNHKKISYLFGLPLHKICSLAPADESSIKF